MKDIILFGGGGHCKSVIDVIEEEGKFKIAGIVDKKEKLGEKILGYEIIASDDYVEKLSKEYQNAFVTVGQVGNCDVRKDIYHLLKKFCFRLPVIVSHYAYVSKYAEIGEGTIIMHGAVVNAGAKVGVNCIVNSNSLLEHDVIIEDFCHISTAVVINGGVRVGECSFIGSNSTMKQYIDIPSNSFIKAGSLMK